MHKSGQMHMFRKSSDICLADLACTLEQCYILHFYFLFPFPSNLVSIPLQGIPRSHWHFFYKNLHLFKHLLCIFRIKPWRCTYRRLKCRWGAINNQGINCLLRDYLKGQYPQSLVDEHCLSSHKLQATSSEQALLSSVAPFTRDLSLICHPRTSAPLLQLLNHSSMKRWPINLKQITNICVNKRTGCFAL